MTLLRSGYPRKSAVSAIPPHRDNCYCYRRSYVLPWYALLRGAGKSIKARHVHLPKSRPWCFTTYVTQIRMLLRKYLLTCLGLERHAGIGPASRAWKARAQPLYQCRICLLNPIGWGMKVVSYESGRDGWARTTALNLIRIAPLTNCATSR